MFYHLNKYFLLIAMFLYSGIALCQETKLNEPKLESNVTEVQQDKVTEEQKEEPSVEATSAEEEFDSSESVFTRNQKRIQLQFLSSNIGSGLGAGWYISPSLYTGIENYSYDEAISTSTLTVTANFNTTLIFVRHFTSNDSGFYLQGGLAQRDWNVTGENSSTNHEVKIVWNDTMPNFGVGWSWIGDSGISGGIQITKNLGSSGTVTTKNATTSQEASYASLSSSYASVMLLGFSVGYNF
jgi:hypothetical protein